MSFSNEDTAQGIELTSNLEDSVDDRRPFIHHGSDSDDFDEKTHPSNSNAETTHGGHHGAGAPGSATDMQVAVNTIISFVGAGLLGISDAFRQSGWLLGSITLCVVSALNVYSMLRLPKVRNKLQHSKVELENSDDEHLPEQTGPQDYGGLSRAILGERGGKFVNICLIISQIGFATAYIIFIAANFKAEFGLNRGWTCLLCVPGLALLVQARDMKYLAPFSLLADVANLMGLSAVLLEDWEEYTPHNDTIHAIKWEGFLQVVAITLYSMEGVALILSLEQSHQEPARFPRLFKLVLASITIFMAFFGSAGYWAFGDNTQAPITLNLTGTVTATFVRMALCLALYFTYPIMMFPVWSIVSDSRWRVPIVVVTAVIAWTVPDFGKFLGLVGSSICTLLGFILPCYFHVKTCEMPPWQQYLDYFLIGSGSIFAVVGTLQSFYKLFEGEELD